MGISNPTMFYPIPITQQNRQSATDVITCIKCGCQWMELITVQQYPRIHNVVLGQKPAAQDSGYYLFRCPKCNELYEPSIQMTPHELTKSTYGKFIEQLESPLPEVKKEEGNKIEKI